MTNGCKERKTAGNQKPQVLVTSQKQTKHARKNEFKWEIFLQNVRNV